METVVTIKKTQEAIKYYQMAIINAQVALNSEVEKDKAYTSFCRDLRKLSDVSIIFHEHIQVFSAFSFRDDKIIRYFTITDEKIIYDENNTFDYIEDTANKLLSIVKKFF